MINMANEFYESQMELEDINKTYVSLIPKVSNPSSSNEFRPSSLCNVSYKIISKVLVTRLK